MSQYFATLTAYGEEKLANCTALGIPFDIAKMGVGDGNGAVPVPDRLRTALVREVRRAPLNSLARDSANTSQLIAEQVIPENEGGWFIREMGLYDEAGGLVAYSNAPETYKPLMAEGSGRTQVLRMVLMVSSDAQITLKVDPSVVLATREQVSKAIADELAKLDGKLSVLYTTTGNIVLSGLGAQAGGDWPAVLPDGARVLVKNQADGSKNGIYTAAAGAWARSADADASIEVTPGMFVTVEQGATLADTTWSLITDAPIALGTTPMVFERLGGKSGVTPGTFNSVTVDQYGRVVGGVNVGYITASDSVQGKFKNLIGWADGTSSTANYFIDEHIVGDGAGNYKTLKNVSFAINLVASGANGLDTGTVDANSWYSTWAIYNPNTNTVAGIAALCPVLAGGTTAGSRVVTGLTSTASMRVGMPIFGGSFPSGTVIKSVDSASQITASRKATATSSGVPLTFVYDPVLPSGYTFKARVGMIRTDGTMNKYPLSIQQIGRSVSYVIYPGSNVIALPSIASGAAGSPSTGTYVPVSVSAVAPPTASRIRGHLGVAGSQQAVVAPNANWGGYVATSAVTLALNGQTIVSHFDYMLESANIFYAASGGAGISCIGWEDNL